ncbi:zona pellucida sperm-binding protein 3 [Amia ocellicauda]|uniref:zona pellucida sperm-binding protein 3 n=1 Tax=Amia ocellicauda TaxID=2972642 RepID=UPI003464E05B
MHVMLRYCVLVILVSTWVYAAQVRKPVKAESLSGRSVPSALSPRGSRGNTPRKSSNMARRPTVQRSRLRLPEFGNPDDQRPDVAAVKPVPVRSPAAPLPASVKDLLIPQIASLPKRPGGPVPEVSLTCLDTKMIVRVKRTFYGLGATSAQLTLGKGCKNNGILRGSGDFLFRYSLQDCGTRRLSTPGYIVYRNVIRYVPTKRWGPVRRSQSIDVGVKCRYKRFHYSYKLAVHPTWQPATLVKTLEGEEGHFGLKIMNDDWTAYAVSNVYTLGQVVNFQARVNRGTTGGEAKLYLKSCYVTPSYYPNSKQAFSVIQNYGCMVDSKVRGSRSKFVPPRTVSTINFSIDAFQFRKRSSYKVYLHCTMFITKDAISPTAKACTYNHKRIRWEEVEDIESRVCECCNSKCTAPEASPVAMDVQSSGPVIVDGSRPMQEEDQFPNISVSEDAQLPSAEEWKSTKHDEDFGPVSESYMEMLPNEHQQQEERRDKEEKLLEYGI